MSRNEIWIEASAPRVWQVLADGPTYGEWVVGAQRIRSLDESWPAVGSEIHHTVGVAVFTINDMTEVTACEPEKRLELRAYARPLGIAHVVFELEEGRPFTRVVMTEEPSSPMLKRIWNPVLDGLTSLRNLESLRRLKAIAESGLGERAA